MNKSISFGAIALVLGAALSGAAYAQASHATFQDFDANGDGQITKEEYQSQVGGRYQKAYSEGRRVGAFAANAPTFADLDANGDGVISKQEFGQQRAAGAEKRRDRRAERRLQGQQ